MKFFRALATASVAILCALLTSCIEGREEVWLNANGGGRAEMTYDIPAAAARFQGGTEGVEQLIESLLSKLPSHSQEITEDGDRLKIHVKFAFNSPDDLTSLTSGGAGQKMPSSFQHLGGVFDVRRELLTVNFTRTVSPAKALPVGFIPKSEFENRKLTYIIHLPAPASENNATRVEDQGRTLTWEQPLTTAIRRPIVVHFKARIPIPTWLTAVVVGAGAIVAISMAKFFTRRKSTSPAGPII